MPNRLWHLPFAHSPKPHTNSHRNSETKTPKPSSLLSHTQTQDSSMEGDDEFGDLYTDVLQPFASSSSSSPPFPPPLPPPISNSPLPPAATDYPIHEQERQSPQQRQIPELAGPPSPDLNPTKESDADSMHNDVKFDIEDDAAADGLGSEPIIPGLSAGGHAEGSGGIDERREGGDDWDNDSDSDDDLQIVLNDNNSLKAMEQGGMVVDDGDEDGGLNIVAGGEPNEGAEEQEWGESAAQTVEGERKDAAELGKGGGGVAAAAKVGYGHQGYHPPFHSHFKYVRPGAAAMPGATTAPGGPPGQIRPLANVNPVAGRGRGDWRPAGMKGAAGMQKGFHAGPGGPVWGNSATGRGFGGGLEFTLPSHKTIFDVDIDGFEEKPWKYPGVDVSVFFNFDLNEDSWKDYCKQLEQLRLESTMQSKIRVYESGRTGQEFDPDLPPELAAATGVHDVPVENANSVKSDVGQSDLMKGSGTVRPPLPTGRAIQVEGGYGERLPSIDTRPPRIRDSDAIIEIVLQDTADDDSSVGIDVQDQPEGGEPQRENFREDNVVGDEIPRLEPDYLGGFPKDYNGRKRELVGRRMPFMNSIPANIPDQDENLPFPPEETDHSDSMPQTPRQMQGRVRGQSPRITPRREMTIVDNREEESVASMEDRHSAHLSSPAIKDARESSVENKDAELEETGTADGSSRLEEDIDVDTIDNRDTLKDETTETQQLTSGIEQPLLDEGDDWEHPKAARSSDNSKARSASRSSRDYQKQREGFEEEVVQDLRPMHQGSTGQQSDENEQVFDGRDCGGRQEPERNHMVIKGKEEPWMRSVDDRYSIRGRNDEPRKRDRGKVRENERTDKNDSIHSRKQLDNGSYRVTYNKDVGSKVSRHRERDDGLKGRHEAMEDFHNNRRKDEEYLRREHIDKEEILHGYRENARHRRGRDEVLDLRKRDGHQRSRDNLEDQYAARQKDEAWLLRERGNRKRDREEWHRLKQSYEELPSKREREEGRSSVRSGRGVEEKTWVGHVRAKDEHKVSDKEYQYVEAMRRSDQLKRKDRVRGESPHHKGRDDAYARGIQYGNEEKRPKQEKSSRHGDRVANVSNNHRVHDRKHKEGSRKSKEPVDGSFSSLGMSKRSQEDQSGQSKEKGLKGSGDEEHVEQEIPGHRLTRKHQEDVSSDDEQQDSQRGHSKSEHWTSHKERDFIISSKSSSSLKFKDLDKDNNDGSSKAGKPVDESAKIVDPDNQSLSLAEGKDYMDMESKDADTRGLSDRHLDTVEKLKKRSERFKLPMRSEKESIVIKKIESEPLPSAKSENPVDSEVKQERPARKRRWK